MILMIYSDRPHSVVADVLDCLLHSDEFERHSRHYIQLWTNTLQKDLNPRILPAMG